MSVDPERFHKPVKVRDVSVEILGRSGLQGPYKFCDGLPCRNTQPDAMLLPVLDQLWPVERVSAALSASLFLPPDL
jgi:hypothetical protein